MILVDTSVWIEHLRVGRRDLQESLEEGRVCCHPFVVGELACGAMPRRHEFLEDLVDLPMLGVAEHGEAMRLLEAHRLVGSGLGWIDVHLLASALLANVGLWTLDRRLASVARRAGVSGT